MEISPAIANKLQEEKDKSDAEKKKLAEEYDGLLSAARILADNGARREFALRAPRTYEAMVAYEAMAGRSPYLGS